MEVRGMKLLATLALALVIPIAAQVGSAQPGPAATAWLGLVDTGGYAASWSQSSTLVQSRMTEPQWQAAVSPVRAPLGAVVTRSISGIKTTDTLPGAPDGHYAVVSFTTRFAHKASATETVTMVEDGEIWKAAGYFIR
jgi:hypothetical protein